MFDLLSRGDQREIRGSVIEILAFFHDLLAFGDEAFHALARFALR